jgi:hypothetical protein
MTAKSILIVLPMAGVLMMLSQCGIDPFVVGGGGGSDGGVGNDGSVSASVCCATAGYPDTPGSTCTCVTGQGSFECRRPNGNTADCYCQYWTAADLITTSQVSDCPKQGLSTSCGPDPSCCIDVSSNSCHCGDTFHGECYSGTSSVPSCTSNAYQNGLTSVSPALCRPTTTQVSSCAAHGGGG